MARRPYWGQAKEPMLIDTCSELACFAPSWRVAAVACCLVRRGAQVLPWFRFAADWLSNAQSAHRAAAFNQSPLAGQCGGRCARVRQQSNGIAEWRLTLHRVGQIADPKRKSQWRTRRGGRPLSLSRASIAQAGESSPSLATGLVSSPSGQCRPGRSWSG